MRSDGLFSVPVSESFLKWHSNRFLMLFFKILPKIRNFSAFRNVCDRWTDGQTHGRTDTTSCRYVQSFPKSKLTQPTPSIRSVTGSIVVVKTRPDTRHKMRLVCFLFTFENNTGHTDQRTDGPTDERTQPHIEMRRRI